MKACVTVHTASCTLLHGGCARCGVHFFFFTQICMRAIIIAIVCPLDLKHCNGEKTTMRKITLGKTNITVNKNGFGALPIQRISDKDAVYLLHKAFDNGIDFYDTARYYTDSEEKLGMAFQDRRDKIFLASKTGAENTEDFWKDLETTLRNLKTDYLDIYQFHNTPFCPKPGDGSVS